MIPGAATRGLIVVDVGQLQVSARRGATLITYALGSCLGVTVYDPIAGVGGLLHAVLPRIELDSERARAEPALFVESGIPALFRACYALGARKERLLVRLAGAGTAHQPGADRFEIGRRNLLVARQLFWKNGVLVRNQDVGGSASRTLSLHIGSGAVEVRSAGKSIHL